MFLLDGSILLCNIQYTIDITNISFSPFCYKSEDITNESSQVFEHGRHVMFVEPEQFTYTNIEYLFTSMHLFNNFLFPNV